MASISYVPHGINIKQFYPIDLDSFEFDEYMKFRDDFISQTNAKFVVFWNNRNIRRKQPGDVILSFKVFCDMLKKEDAEHCLLFMHTDIIDENGTDLMAVAKAVCPYKVMFLEDRIETKLLNYYYNISDVVLNIASNEGFGLSSAEALATGTVIVNNVTGGLQDQMRFVDENNEPIKLSSTFTSNHSGKYRNCGPWAYPVFPSNRSLQGSIYTPYIFDDRCSYDDVALGIKYWFDMPVDERINCGLKGREWIVSRESGMSSKEMARRFSECIKHTLNNWKPRKRFKLYKLIDEINVVNKIGIV